MTVVKYALTRDEGGDTTMAVQDSLTDEAESDGLESLFYRGLGYWPQRNQSAQACSQILARTGPSRLFTAA